MSNSRASIWHVAPTLAQINKLNKNNLGEFFEIIFTEIGEDYLKATMPVNSKTKQPAGLLHGGASAALAETIGSVASYYVVDNTKFFGVGIEINANHVRSAKSGLVTAICKPHHLGGKIHVWDIKIYNEANQLLCISRLTTTIVALTKL